MAWLDIRQEELTLEARKLDTLFWSSIVDKRPAVRKAMPKRVDKVTGGDLFNALYQWDPKIKEEPSDPALAAWLTNRMADPQFQELRNKTMGDRNIAAGASIRLYRELMRPKESQFKAIVTAKDSLDNMEQMLGDTPGAQQAITAIKNAQQTATRPRGMGEDFTEEDCTAPVTQAWRRPTAIAKATIRGETSMPDFLSCTGSSPMIGDFDFRAVNRHG